MGNNRELYSKGAIADAWAERQHSLQQVEDYLITRYFGIEGPTVEAGTGNGRILYSLHERGFEDLHGFDYSEYQIEAARKANTDDAIDFIHADAREQPYPDNYARQFIALEQVLCFITPRDGRDLAMREIHRVLQPGGCALFSFLCYNGRHRGITGLFCKYLSLLRFVTRSKTDPHDLPWLRCGRRRFNWKAFLDLPPRNHWYTYEDAWSSLENAGLQIQAATTIPLAEREETVSSLEDLKSSPASTGVYFVCTKPTNP